MERRPRILVIGSLNMDLVFRAEHIPEDGQTILGTEFRQVPGGKGANQAVAAARLGAEVIMLGCVGDDALGQALLANLEKNKVRTELIHRSPALPSGVAAILLDARGNNRIIVFPGANGCLLPDDLIERWNEVVPVDVVVLQLEIPLATVVKAVELCRTAGIPVILNPAPARSLDRGLLSAVTVLTPNETEAEFLSGVRASDAASAAAAAARLRSDGGPAVIVTLGDLGILVVDEIGTEYIPAYAVQVVDTVAAGDAFTGALAVGLAGGRSLRDAARYANAAAAMAVMKPGAQDAMPTSAEVEAFLSRQIGSVLHNG